MAGSFKPYLVCENMSSHLVFPPVEADIGGDFRAGAGWARAVKADKHALCIVCCYQ